MNRNSSSGRALIWSMTQMSSIGTVPVALGSKMAQNLRRWSARSWMIWAKVPVFLITSSCWRRLCATAKLEDRECSSLAIMYIAYESLSSAALLNASTEQRCIWASSDKDERTRWQTLASSSRRCWSRFSNVEVALRKLLRLDSVSAVGFSGWKLLFRTVESPMRSAIVGWGKMKGVPLRMAEPTSRKAVSFIFKWWSQLDTLLIDRSMFAGYVVDSIE